MGSKKTVSI